MSNPENSHPTPPIPDDAVAEEMALIADEDLPQWRSPGRPTSSRSKDSKGKSVAGATLAAMMLGVGELIEPSKTAEVAIEQAGDEIDPEKDILANFDFGDLPPLN